MKKRLRKIMDNPHNTWLVIVLFLCVSNMHTQIRLYLYAGDLTKTCVMMVVYILLTILAILSLDQEDDL